MKNLTALVVVVGASVAGTAAVALLMPGCGSGSTPTPTPDASGDSPADSTVIMDSALDTTPPPDTQADTMAADADAGPTTDGEAGGPDASQIFQFPGRVSQAYCQRLQTCCAPSDGGFDFNFCVTSTLGQGGVGGDGLGNYNGLIPNNGGAITFNSAMAQSCLTDIANIPCGMITSQALLQIRNDCYGALVGTIAVGSNGCTTNLDCAPGGYCNIVGDAGSGQCTALVAGGGGCAFNEQCTYRGTGQPAQFCNTSLTPPSCVPQAMAAAACGFTFFYEQECTTELCVQAPGGGGMCGTTTVFSDPGVAGGICASLGPQDAGGGG
jgi:hypothetical protein